jgi:hypothetical protein
MSEVEDTSMQKVGMRDDKEKETYEPYTSRERCYERLYQRSEEVEVAGVRTMKVSKSTQL